MNSRKVFRTAACALAVFLVACCGNNADDDSILAHTETIDTTSSSQESVCPSSLVSEEIVEITLEINECENTFDECLEKCRGGDAEYCLASAYAAQSLGDDRHPGLFEKACLMGVASGCTNFAAVRFNKANRIADSCTAELFQLACDSGDNWGCTMTAVLFATGNGVERNWEKASDMIYYVCEDVGDDHEQCQYGSGVIEGASFIKD